MIENSVWIAFTGTQEGMTARQKRKLRIILECALAYEPRSILSHGDCIGADAEAHGIALDVGLRISIHPPSDPKKRAFCSNEAVLWNPLPYLERNKQIVNGSRFLIVAPKSRKEELRSGTWSTKRYAEKIGVPYLIL
jgi:hypothetical protein